MRFTTEKKIFLDALKAVLPVVPTKPLHHLADCFSLRFREDGKTLVVGGTNGTNALLAHLEPEFVHDSSGAIVVNARLLSDYVRGLPDGSVTLDSSQHLVLVRSEVARKEASLPISDPGAYTTLPKPEDLPSDQWYQVPRLQFLDSLQAVRSAVPHDATQQMLYMVAIRSASADVGSVFTATDTIRLHRVAVGGLILPEFDVSALSLLTLTRLLSSSEEESIGIWVGKEMWTLRVGQIFAVYRRPGARFPDVSKSIMQPTLMNSQKLFVRKDALLSALDSAGVVADGVSQAVVLELSDGEMVVKAKSVEGATVQETLEVMWPHEPIKLAFRLKYLHDALTAYPGDLCEVRIASQKDSPQGAVLLVDAKASFEAVVSQLKLELL